MPPKGAQRWARSLPALKVCFAVSYSRSPNAAAGERSENGLLTGVRAPLLLMRTKSSALIKGGMSFMDDIMDNKHMFGYIQSSLAPFTFSSAQIENDNLGSSAPSFYSHNRSLCYSLPKSLNRTFQLLMWIRHTFNLLGRGLPRN
jgi:hypothetical protein